MSSSDIFLCSIRMNMIYEVLDQLLLRAGGWELAVSEVSTKHIRKCSSFNDIGGTRVS